MKNHHHHHPYNALELSNYSQVEVYNPLNNSISNISSVKGLVKCLYFVT